MGCSFHRLLGSTQPKNFRLFLISGNAIFFLGVAMLVEWFVHGQHHAGFFWIIDYAPVMMALPVFIWILGFIFAVVFYKTRKIHLLPPLHQHKPTAALPLQPPELEELQLVKGQTTQDQMAHKQTSSTCITISLAHEPVVSSPPETSEGEALALLPKGCPDDSEITQGRNVTLAIKGDEDLGQMRPEQVQNDRENVGHDSNGITDVEPECPWAGSRPNGSKEEEKGKDPMHDNLECALHDKELPGLMTTGVVAPEDKNSLEGALCDEEFPRRMTTGVVAREGKNRNDPIVNISFSVPMCYTRSLKLNRSSSL